MSREFFARGKEKLKANSVDSVVRFRKHRRDEGLGHISAPDALFSSESSFEYLLENSPASLKKNRAEQEEASAASPGSTPLDKARLARYGSRVGYNINLALERARECGKQYQELSILIDSAKSTFEIIQAIVEHKNLIFVISELRKLLQNVNRGIHGQLSTLNAESNEAQELTIYQIRLNDTYKIFGDFLDQIRKNIAQVLAEALRSDATRIAINSEQNCRDFMDGYVKGNEIFAILTHSTIPPLESTKRKLNF